MRGLRIALLAALALSILAGCTFVDTLDRRADFMNESVTRFRNQTILRNIIRSSNDEPLSFAALATVQGHNTSVNQIPTFPTFSWQSWIPGQTQNASSSYNVSSDFTLSPVDDSGTYAALLAPLDLATIAAFTQGYGLQTNFLYLLFFDQIKIADPSGRVVAHYYSNNAAADTSKVRVGRFEGSRTMVAYTLLAYLNLQVNLEKGGLPGQATRKPRTQICFAREYSPSERWSDIGFKPTGGRVALPAKRGKPASFCDEEGTWIAPPASAEQGKASKTTAHYTVFDARNNVWIELSTRSTFGIYQFLGTLAYSQLNEKQAPVRLIQPGYPNTDELILLNIEKGEAGNDCFAAVEDRGFYCVPNGPKSRLTRYYFSILHQLMALQRAAVAIPQGTSSTRNVP